VENLVTNAVKYGSPDTLITVRISSHEARVILSVHNDGPPIPVEEQKGLFLPFRRSEAARASVQRGWGLGLALVRSVAEAHGGSIGLDSAPGTGTTFTIDVPQDARPFQGAPVSGA
jgi:signal transduction histidine kinase